MAEHFAKQTLAAPAQIAYQSAIAHLQLTGPITVAWAPGRINIIGEHTDYNDGLVLPVAIERVVAIAGQINPDPSERIVRLYSAQFNQSAEFSLDALPTSENTNNTPLWARYVSGVLAEMQQQGIALPAFSATITGDVPLGGGMSSSAALLIACITWLQAVTGKYFPPIEQAKIGQSAEFRGSGVHVGILDQAASVLGRPQQATMIDCRTLEYRYVPFNVENIELVSCETGVERSLANSGYNQRRQECEEAYSYLRKMVIEEDSSRTVLSMRDITKRDLLRLGGYLPINLLQRVRHVITENERVYAMMQSLADGNLEAIGTLLLESHASLRDDYEVSCPELDAVVEIATSPGGALGARLVGAGFGGSAIIAVHHDNLESVIQRIKAQYPLQTGKTPIIHSVKPSGGPGWVVI